MRLNSRRYAGKAKGKRGEDGGKRWGKEGGADRHGERERGRCAGAHARLVRVTDDERRGIPDAPPPIRALARDKRGRAAAEAARESFDSRGGARQNVPRMKRSRGVR